MVAVIVAGTAAAMAVGGYGLHHNSEANFHPPTLPSAGLLLSVIEPAATLVLPLVVLTAVALLWWNALGWADAAAEAQPDGPAPDPQQARRAGAHVRRTRVMARLARVGLVLAGLMALTGAAGAVWYRYDLGGYGPLGYFQNAETVFDLGLLAGALLLCVIGLAAVSQLVRRCDGDAGSSNEVASHGDPGPEAVQAVEVGESVGGQPAGLGVEHDEPG